MPINRYIIAGVLLVLSLFTFTIIWISNKCFDLYDEGLYIAGYNNLLEYPYWFTSFNFLSLNSIAKYGNTLVYFRIVRAILLIVGNLFLSYAILKWLQHRKNNPTISFNKLFIQIFAIAFIGSLPSYGFGPQTLSYNHYNIFFITTFLGILFLILTYKNFLKRNILFSVIAGIIAGLDFYIKIPTAILLTACFIFIQIVAAEKIKKEIFLQTGCYLSGFVMSFSLIALPQSPLTVLTDYYQTISTVSKYYSHDTLYVLKNYYNGIIDLATNHLVSFTGIIVIYTALFVIEIYQYNVKYKKALPFVFWGTSIYCVYLITHRGYQWSGIKSIGSAPVVYFFFLLLSLILVFILWKKNYSDKKQKFTFADRAAFLLLLGFPIIGSMGTGNQIHIQVIIFLNTWFLFFYIILYYLYLQKNNLFKWYLVLFSALLIKPCCDFVSGLIIDPYKLQGNLTEQTSTLIIQHNNEHILVHPNLLQTITDIKKIIDRENPVNFYTSSEVIGLSYIFNKKMIGHGWYDSGISPRFFMYESYNKSKIKDNGSTLFILNNGDQKNDLLSELSDTKTTHFLGNVAWTNYGEDSLYLYIRK